MDWWTCWVEDNVFCGAGGPLHLRSLLEAFRDWATSGRP
ncbi:Imm53 family immunity protein [Neorhizobium galegae]